MSLKIFDEILKSKLKHLQYHPNYLPHIGKNYETIKTKTFIIAESHYLPSYYNNKFSAEEWYNNHELIYTTLSLKKDNAKGWFNTRGVIDDYQSPSPLSAGHRIFLNLEIAFKELHTDRNLFEECVYLNYFQRPAEIQGDSIKIHKIDSKIALENLLVLIDVLKPHKIIFVSSKAHEDFLQNTTESEREKLPYVGSVPHPSASSWWNRKSPKYGLKGQSATGKEKFLRIMKPKN